MEEHVIYDGFGTPMVVYGDDPEETEGKLAHRLPAPIAPSASGSIRDSPMRAEGPAQGRLIDLLRRGRGKHRA